MLYVSVSQKGRSINRHVLKILGTTSMDIKIIQTEGIKKE